MPSYQSNYPRYFQIFPISCRLGRWALAAVMVHEIVHIAQGTPQFSKENEDEADTVQETICGVYAP